MATPSEATESSSGDPPIVAPDVYTTSQGDNLSIDDPGVLANHSDPEGDSLKAFLVSSAGAAGVLFLYEDGSLEYEPAQGFVGTDTFMYVANDGTQDSTPTTVEFIVTPGGVDGPITFIDQPAFLAAIAARGWSTTQESFESSLWPRTPATATGVSDLDVTWSGNNASSDITTGTGPAIFGQYGFYQLPHGSYTTGTGCNIPGACTDGWVATSDTGKFTAAGIWIHCNAGQAGIELILDGDTTQPVDFGGFGLSAGSTGFYGVIDGNGFQSIEVHETEGKAEDAAYIFADLFTFARAPQAQAVPYGCGVNPSGSLTVLAGQPAVGGSVTLGLDNPLDSQDPGALSVLVVARDPAPGFPCGPLLPGYGMAGAGSAGELLVSLAPPNPILTLFGPAWTGAGAPVHFTLDVPALPALIGLSYYAQGLLLGPLSERCGTERADRSHRTAGGTLTGAGHRPDLRFRGRSGSPRTAALPPCCPKSCPDPPARWLRKPSSSRAACSSPLKIPSSVARPSS